MGSFNFWGSIDIPLRSFGIEYLWSQGICYGVSNIRGTVYFISYDVSLTHRWFISFTWMTHFFNLKIWIIILDWVKPKLWIRHTTPWQLRSEVMHAFVSFRRDWVKGEFTWSSLCEFIYVYLPINMVGVNYNPLKHHWLFIYFKLFNFFVYKIRLDYIYIYIY